MAEYQIFYEVTAILEEKPQSNVRLVVRSEGPDIPNNDFHRCPCYLTTSTSEAQNKGYSLFNTPLTLKIPTR